MQFINTSLRSFCFGFWGDGSTYVQLIPCSFVIMTPCPTDPCETTEIDVAVPAFEFLKALPYLDDCVEYSVQGKMRAIRSLLNPPRPRFRTQTWPTWMTPLYARHRRIRYMVLTSSSFTLPKFVQGG